jgi:Flp pilus assembly protein TadG
MMTRWHTLRNRIRAIFRNDSGISSVEVGITLLPFLLVVFGVAEFGWYFLHTHTMNAAVSEGIRIGATGAVRNDGDGDPMSREDSIKQAILDRSEGVMVIAPADIKIFQVDADWTDPDDPAVVDAADGGEAGAFMRVRVLYNHQFFTDLVGGFFSEAGSIQLTSEGTYRNENFILGGA